MRTALAAAVLFASTLAGAQEAFPTKAINLVNPNPPGGFVDNTGRGLAQAMQKVLKQPVLVLNRPGANGAIGAAQVGNAAPDGYTLLVTSPSFATQPAIDELYGKQPLYTLAKFVPLAQITSDPAILVANPALGVRTVLEFVARARQQAEAVIISSSGTYGATHLPMAMLEMATGIKLRHVPTSGGAPALQLALGGHAHALAAAPSVAYGQIQGKKLVALAQSGARRMAPFTDVPTFKESGIDLEFALWTSVFAPAGTPPAVLKTLSDAMRQAAQDEEFRAQMTKGYSTVSYVDGEEFARLFRSEVEKLQGTVRHIGKVDGTN